MAITYVGGKTTSHNNSAQTISLTDLTGGSDAAPAANDIVIVINGHPETADTDVSITTSGYTNQELYSDDTRDAGGAFAYKVMGGTPDTDVTVPATTSGSAEGSTVIKVWRGVDTTTPLDVTTVTATGINGTLANGGAITPTTAGAKILALLHGTQPASTSTAITGPSNMSNFLGVFASGGGRSSWAGIAEFDWTSGAFNPNAVTGGGANANDSWVAFTVALRPAASGDTPVSLDTPAYTQTLNDLSVAVDMPVALDSTAYVQTLNDLTVAVNTPVALDSLAYSATLNDVGVAAGTDTPVALDALSYAVTLNDVSVATSVTVALDSLSYAATLNDMGVAVDTGEVTQPGGWLPVKYVNRKGQVVDLAEVREVVAEVAEEVAETPAVQARVVEVSGRVLDALALRTEPRREDVRALRRLLADYQEAINALNDAIMAQQLLDDEITVLLLAS